MNRRSFIAAAGAGVATLSNAQSSKRSIIGLSWVRLRNSPDQQLQRTRDYITQSVLPAYKRAGVGPIGVFSNTIGPESPSILVVAGHPDLASIDSLEQKLLADKEFGKAAVAYNSMPGLGYQRIERSLLRAFETMPKIEVPPTEGRSASRVFELRRYESSNTLTLHRKIKMFGEGEIGIFQRLNMLPVFFGETIVGTNMPNLTYMLAFDSMAAREKAWQAFGQDSEWQKMRSQPGVSDAEVVSNISNWIVSPLPGSDIR